MAFLRYDPIRNKIIITNKCPENELRFHYPGYDISYEGEKVISFKIKMPKYWEINNIPEILILSSEIWTLRKSTYRD